MKKKHRSQYIKCITLNHHFLKRVAPKINDPTTRIIKIKKMILAIDAAPAAMPVKPNIAATMAINKNVAVHFSIVVNLIE